MCHYRGRLSILAIKANPPILRLEKIRGSTVYPVSEGLPESLQGQPPRDPGKRNLVARQVIQNLLKAKRCELEAWGKGTDCYPRKHIKTLISKIRSTKYSCLIPGMLTRIYNVAVNTTNRLIHTYMGTLLPGLRNATYSTSGELSPLLNDPELRTIGIGTRIFLGGAEGFVVWPGTQFNTSKPVNQYGIPVSNARTIAVIGNLKEMSAEFIQAAYFDKYGTSLFVGLGIPIPILDEEIARFVSIRNDQIETSVLDYGTVGMPKLGQVTYAELRSGYIRLGPDRIRTAPVASLTKARKIAALLKKAIEEGNFEITRPVKMFPAQASLKSLIETEKEDQP